MVYAFFVGLTVGLPMGCYLREVGYAKKFKDAYYIFAAAPDTHTSDKFKSKSEEFYKNIKKGQVDHA